MRGIKDMLPPPPPPIMYTTALVRCMHINCVYIVHNNNMEICRQTEDLSKLQHIRFFSHFVKTNMTTKFCECKLMSAID